MDSSAVTVKPDLLTQLRAETHVQHEAIERTLKLMNDDLSLVSYRHRLEQLYGFYKPVEDRIFGLGSALGEWVDLQKRHKMFALEADLNVLGLQTLEQLPLCRDLPPLDGVAECFGCMYVLEGATLGGVLISRYIHEALGVTSTSGGQFFNGYGKQTGAMWHEFRAAVTAFSLVTDQQDVVISAARTTFETLQQWCERKQTA